MILAGFTLDMFRIFVCISGRKSGWFLREGKGEEEGGREVLDTQTVL